MKKRLKKPARLLLTLGAIAVPATLAVSCTSTDYGDSWKLDSHRSINMLTSNGDGINDTYGFPSKIKNITYLYNANISFLINSQQVGLFSKVKTGYDRFEKKESVNSDGHKETKVVSTANRNSYLKFELAKNVLLKYSNGTSTTFDSDSIEASELNSQTSKSINSLNFKNKIKSPGLSSIEFGLSDKITNGEAHWTQEITGAKKDKIIPEDFWTSLQMRIYHSSPISLEKEENKIIKKDSDKTISNINQFVNKKAKWSVFNRATSSQAPSFWVSTQGRQMYGLDYKKFLISDQNKFDFLGIKSNAEKSKKIVIPFDSNVDGDKKLLFWKNQIAKNNLFALSTLNMKKLINNHTLPRSLFYDKKTYDDFLSSDFYKTGIFSWFLADNEDEYVVGGKYYVSKNDKKIRELRANKHYLHYDYFFNKIKNTETNKKTTVLKVSENFIQDSPLKNTIILQGYKEGFSYAATVKALSSNEYNDMLSNPKKWGMKFSTGYTSDNIFGDYGNWQILPGSSNPDVFDNKANKVVPGKANMSVYFNDWYSKVMWGHPTKDLIKPKNSAALPAADWADHYYGGTGIQFVTNILAALNTYTAVHNFSPDYQEWNSLLAPENEINNYDNTSSVNPKIVFQAHPDSLSDNDTRKQILTNTNSKFGLSIFKDSNKTKRNSFDQIKVDREEYVSVNKNPLVEAKRKYGPPTQKLNIIKNNIKLAFDNAGVPLDKKVTFEWPIGRGGSTIALNIVFKKAIEWLNSLDPRMNIVAMAKPRKEATQMLDANVDVQEYSRDFQGLTKVMGGAIGAWYNRLFAAKKGYGAMGIAQKGKYDINSPAGGIFSKTGYLQTGKLLGLSYYSSHPNLIKNNALSGLKILIESEKRVYDDMFKSLDPNNYVTPEVKAIISNLKSNPPKFGELYKNTPGDISSYDYFGLHGFEEVRDLMRTNKYLDKNYKDHNDIQNDVSALSSRISGAISYEAMSDMQLNIENNVYTQEQVIEAITAFNILSPVSLNPLIEPLGNRTNPGISLEKNWFFQGSNSNLFHSFEWFRVDLKENEKGEIIGGGIN